MLYGLSRDFTSSAYALGASRTMQATSMHVSALNRRLMAVRPLNIIEI